jgi:hypothetical protein
VKKNLNIVDYEDGDSWILSAIARRLHEGMLALGVDCHLSPKPEDGFTHCYHIHYWYVRSVNINIKNFSYVTHIDSLPKLQLILAQNKELNIQGICLSSETSRRLNEFSGSQRFTYINPPALTDPVEKKIAVMIAFRLYSDGRKKVEVIEGFVEKFSGKYNIKFYVIGAGWESHVEKWLSLGVDVEYTPNWNRSVYNNLLNIADLLLYTGFDEGAISVLDAIAAGKTVLATGQGFHLDVLSYKKLLLYSCEHDLHQQARGFFDSYTSDLEIRMRISDWGLYCQKHLEVFEL